MKPKYYSRQYPGLIIFAFMLHGILPSAQAADTTWVGNSDATWDTDANWSPAPFVTDDAMFYGVAGTAGTSLNNNMDSITAAGMTFNAGSAAYTISGNAFTLSGPLVNNSLSLQTINNDIVLSLPQTVDTAVGDITLGGVLSFEGINKTGPGTLTLTNENTVGGAAVNRGTLKLDFTAVGAPTGGTGIINGSPLTLGGGRLFMAGSSGGNIQTFSSTALNAGASTVTVTSNGAAADLALGSITRGAGSAIAFIPPSSGAITVGGTTGILLGGNYASYGLITDSSGNVTDIAAVNASNQIAAGMAVLPNTTAGWQANPSGGNLSATVGEYVFNNTVGGNFTLGSNATLGSFFFNTFKTGGWVFMPNSAGRTATMNRIVLSNGVAASNVSIGGTGVIRVSSQLVLDQYNTGGFLTMNPANGFTSTGTGGHLVKNGPGTLAISPTNAAGYAGQTYLNGGTTLIGSNGAVKNDASNINLNGGTLMGTATFALDNGAGVSHPLVLGINGGGLAAQSSTTFTISGVMSGASDSGPLVIGIPASTANGNTAGLVAGTGAGTANTTAVNATGTVIMTGANTYPGATQVIGGTLQVDGAGSIDASSGVSINGGNVKFLQTSSVAGTVPITLTQGMLDGTGTVGAATVGTAGVASTKVVANGNLASNTALTLDSLTFNDTGTLAPRVGGTSSPGLVVTGELKLSGGAGKVVVNPTVAGGLANGSTYQLIGYGSFSGATSGFTLAPGLLSGRQSGTFGSGGGFITLAVSGDSTVWSGAASNVLVEYAPNTALTTGNLTKKIGLAPTDFWTGDVLEFNNTYNAGAGNVAVTQTTVDIAGGAINAGGIAASTLIFNNSINYSLTSSTGKGITAGSLIKNGTGSVSISTANSYTGATSINEGRVNLQNSSALGASSGVTVASGAALELQGDIAFSAVPLILNGTGLTASPAGALRNVSGTNSYDGLVTLASSATIRSDADSLALTNVGAITGSGFALSLDGAGAGSISSGIATGTGELVKNDTGAWALTGANSYTGGTTVKNGTLVLGSGGSMAAANTLTLGDASDTSGVFQLGDSTAAVNTTVTSLTTAGAGTANAVVGGNASANSVLTVNSSSVSSYDGRLGSGTAETSTANNLAFTKSGVGTLTLSGNNTHTGNTSVTGGTLVLTGSNSNGGSTTLIGNGGTLQLQANAGNTLAGVSSVAGSTGALALAAPTNNTQTIGLQLRSDSAVTFANTNYNNATRIAMTVNIDVDTVTPGATGGALTIGNLIGIAGATVNVTGNANGTGSSLIIGAGSGSTGSSQNLNFNPTTADVSLGGYNVTGGTINLGLGGTSSSNFVTGALTNSGGILNVNKFNTSTWTLSGINTYSGNTTVSDGELILADDAGLTFAPGLNGMINKVTGVGTATLRGDFTFNLAGAEITNGNNWTVVDAATKTFGPSFTVLDGFSPSGDVWTKVDGDNTWTFSEATGVLSLSVAESSAYDAWATSKGLTADVNDGPKQDPDFDGISNVLEFVLDGDPLASDTGKLPVSTQDATNFYFDFNRRDDSVAEVTLTFESGTTLAAWPTTVAIPAAITPIVGPPVTITDNGGGTHHVKVTVAKSGNTKLFGRLQAVK